MTTLTETDSRIKTSRPRKPSRTLRLYPSSPALLEMTVGNDCFSYWLRPIPADAGLAFELKKLMGDGGDSYHVCINGKHSTCECPGFLRWGMGKDGTGCKHIASLVKLIAEGKIAAQPSKPQPAAQPAPVAKPAPVRPAATSAYPAELEDL